jgi:Na+/melibiose symporter-like transporter
MNNPIHDNQLNRVWLKPRFKVEMDETEDVIITKFVKSLKENNFIYPNKIVDNHVVIDVPPENEHFWSPQLQIEIEKGENGKTIVKGLLGPKPKVWTFFMFLHFFVAISFCVFLVVFYTKWSLNQDYGFFMIMCIIMPVLWVILYFSGQLGKRFGYDQMLELHDFMMNALSK